MILSIRNLERISRETENIYKDHKPTKEARVAIEALAVINWLMGELERASKEKDKMVNMICELQEKLDPKRMIRFQSLVTNTGNFGKEALDALNKQLLVEEPEKTHNAFQESESTTK